MNEPITNIAIISSEIYIANRTVCSPFLDTDVSGFRLTLIKIYRNLAFRALYDVYKIGIIIQKRRINSKWCISTM